MEVRGFTTVNMLLVILRKIGVIDGLDLMISMLACLTGATDAVGTAGNR